MVPIARSPDRYQAWIGTKDRIATKKRDVKMPKDEYDFIIKIVGKVGYGLSWELKCRKKKKTSIR